MLTGDDMQPAQRQILVPDLHDTAGLLAPDVARQQLIAALGRPIPETAPETALRLAQESSASIVIHGGRNDLRACRVLKAELARSGLQSEIALAQPSPTETENLPRRLSIVEISSLDTPAQNEFANACRDRVAELGSSRVLIQSTIQSGPESELGLRASPIPESLHLETQDWRALLTELINECWPTRIAAWVSLVQADDLAVNPIENVYAGQGLRDRNRDLLVNIL